MVTTQLGLDLVRLPAALPVWHARVGRDADQTAQPGGAGPLPGDEVGVSEGPDDDGAGLGGELEGDLVAILRGGAGEHDVGAE